jgi:hypothetical protein
VVTEDPSQSPYYQVHHEANHADVGDEHRKDGAPSPMPEELRNLPPDELVPGARAADAGGRS